jgi:hypothetical protein
MNHAWRAIHRVGEELSLSESEYNHFLEVATEVYNTKLETASEDYDLDQEYFNFLSYEVFNDESVIELVSDTAVPEYIIRQLENSEFDIESSFVEYTKLDHSLDELVDSVMLLKLFIDYEGVTGTDSLSRTKLQYLLYLINNHLSDQQDPSLKIQKTDLGMLERTGYRYTFRKMNRGVKSSRLADEVNRLIAYNLIDEKVGEQEPTNSHSQFDLSLGKAGEYLTTEHNESLKLANMDSVLLEEWAICQKDIIREWGRKSVDEIENHIIKLNSYDQKPNGTVLLTGRAQIFDEDEQEVFENIMTEVKKANV